MPLVIAQRTAARLVLAAAAMGAGAIHLAFSPEHLQEYLPLGIGFVVAGVLQIVWALVVAVRDSARWLLAGGVFSLAFIGVYLMSRTVGLPLGPEAFHPEAFGAADLICCALELPVGIGGIVLARRRAALRSRLSFRWAAAVVAALMLVGMGSTTALAASGGHNHVHGHTCPAAPVRTGVADARGVDTGVTAYFTCLLEHEHDHHHA